MKRIVKFPKKTRKFPKKTRKFPKKTRKFPKKTRKFSKKKHQKSQFWCNSEYEQKLCLFSLIYIRMSKINVLIFMVGLEIIFVGQ